MARADGSSDQELLRQAVADLALATRFPVAFGGLESGGVVTIASFVGTRTRSLEGLRVRPQRGLGGRALAERRPRITGNYERSTQITHDYDAAVLGEGIVSLLAVPIVVGGQSRGVLYGGSHATAPDGDVFAKPAIEIAGRLSAELRVRDEVARRLARLSPVAETTSKLNGAAREEVRATYAELRSIASGVDDPALRDRLTQLERRLALLAADDASAAVDAVRLSPRETDVLACVALGYTNAEIARTLTLKEATVKAYLGSAMQKLDASNRHGAISSARRHGIIP